MKFYPITISPRYLCFVFFAFLIIISCTKDNDEFEKTVLDESTTTVKKPVREKEPDAETEEILQEEESVDELVEKVYETRTTIFPAINDAHLQKDAGYNENIVRLEEGQRTSYLMFDLSPIDSIGGKVNTTNLEFTIDSDDGHGTISVFKAFSKDWSEEELTAKTAPETNVLVGELATRYEVGQTQEVALDTAFVRNEILTLILTHEQGNDLAFTSKENPNGKGPALVVTYSAPQDAEAIVIDNEVELELEADIAIDDTTTATEDAAEESTANEESKDTEEKTGEGEVETTEEIENKSHEDESTVEEATKEETTEETEEKATVEEVTKEETSEETTTEEKTTEEETRVDEESKDQSTTEEKSTNEEINSEADAPINESPIAIAEASPSSGDAPLKVNFKGNNSSDDLGIKKYVWDFRDGSTSTEANPTHTFEKTGTLEVRLTVTDDQGASNTDTVTITINEKEENKAPNAIASGSPLTGDAPLNVQLKASDSKDDKEVTSYFWDFKDGSTTTSKNPSHTFSEPGEYEVELSVKDVEGLTDATTLKVTVNQKPVDTGGGNSIIGSGNSSGSGNGSSSGGNSGNYPSNAVLASSFGFRSGDATAAFEAAIKSGSSYVVIDKQSSDWIIRPTRFFDLRNMTIVFEPGVTLRAKSGAFKEGHRLFEIIRAKNVTVEGSGATFRMNKNEYTSGEQRHAFGIKMSSDVTVRGLTLRDSGGAGIYIVGDDQGGYSQNITLENIRCLNHRRDGITITSAQDVWVRNSEFSGSSGTRPEAGVVLETDRPSQRLVNINFINCKFSDNDSAGVHFTASQMNGSSRPLSIKFLDSEFSNNSVSPPSGFLSTEVEIGGGFGTNVVGGEIRFERATFNGSRGAIVFTRKSGNGFKAVFKDCEARNIVSSTSLSPITLEASSDRYTLGGMVFDNFHIQYNKNMPFMQIAAPNKEGSFKVKDISGNFTIKEPGDNPLDYKGSYSYQTHRNENVSINYKHM